MRRFFSEKSIPEEDLNILKWEPILLEKMDKKDKSIFKKRKVAIDLFFGTDQSLNQIISKSGLSSSEIYRIAERCIKYDERNKIMGYRALIPNTTVVTYKRKSLSTGDSNHSGSFKLLLNEYPSLKEFLINEYFKVSSKRYNAREVKISYKNLHRKFINECRKVGIKPHEYPFNTTSLARKSIERFIQEVSNNYISEVAKNSQGQSLMLLNNVNNSSNSNNCISRPLERVEFDGHKIDLILAIEYKTPGGEKIIDIINRIWILTIVDVATRAIIGYHLSLSNEYTKNDIKTCFQAAILPWSPQKLTIPGLKYSENSGFPSYKIPAAKYGIWDEICYDNAKSHLSNEIKDILNKQIGCSINMGPVGVPVRRPIIERLFRSLEENGFHRLPSTTGSNVMDPKRNNAEKNAIKFAITPSALEELCDVIIANYNGAPHDSNNGFSPLEIFESRVNQGMTISQLPVHDRHTINLFPISKTCRVKGNIEKGRRPYINFKNVRYSSPELNKDFSMVNKVITILINTDDLRTVNAYREDGSLYGVLYASGRWGQSPHSLKIRDCINKFKRLRYFNYTNEDDPLVAFQNYLEANAINNKSLRTLLAELQSYKKKYNINEINSEKKKVYVRVEKEKVELQRAIINERKTENTLKKEKLLEETKSLNSIHNNVIEERKGTAERALSLTKINVEENYYEDLIKEEKHKKHRKRKSIIL